MSLLVPMKSEIHAEQIDTSYGVLCILSFVYWAYFCCGWCCCFFLHFPLVFLISLAAVVIIVVAVVVVVVEVVVEAEVLVVVVVEVVVESEVLVVVVVVALVVVSWEYFLLLFLFLMSLLLFFLLLVLLLFLFLLCFRCWLSCCFSWVFSCCFSSCCCCWWGYCGCVVNSFEFKQKISLSKSFFIWFDLILYGIKSGEKEDRNTKNTVFHFYSYYHCLFLFIIDSLSTHLISGFLSLSVMYGCFVIFEVFYFFHRFPIVNSAIVEIFKLATFCTSLSIESYSESNFI